MFERFSATARAVVIRAKTEAGLLGHPLIGTEHILLALLEERDGAAYTVLWDLGLDAARVRADICRLIEPAPGQLLSDEDAEALRAVGIDLDEVRARLEESFGPSPLDPPREKGGTTRTRFSRRAKKALELSLREAIHLKQRRIGTEHLLLGLIREGEGLAAKILVDAGLDLNRLRQAVLADVRDAA